MTSAQISHKSFASGNSVRHRPHITTHKLNGRIAVVAISRLSATFQRCNGVTPCVVTSPYGLFPQAAYLRPVLILYSQPSQLLSSREVEQTRMLSHSRTELRQCRCAILTDLRWVSFAPAKFGTARSRAALERASRYRSQFIRVSPRTLSSVSQHPGGGKAEKHGARQDRFATRTVPSLAATPALIA